MNKKEQPQKETICQKCFDSYCSGCEEPQPVGTSGEATLSDKIRKVAVGQDKITKEKNVAIDSCEEYIDVPDITQTLKKIKKRICLQIIDEVKDEPCDECIMCKAVNEESGEELING